MKKLIIQLLCAEITRLRQIVAIERKEVLTQHESGKSAVVIFESENTHLKAENKRLQAENENLNGILNAEIADWSAGISAKVTPDYQARFDAITRRISELKTENERLVKENKELGLQKILFDTPQWKNSVKDGKPVLKVGQFIMIRTQQGCMKFEDFEIDSEDYLLKVTETLAFSGDFDYYIINLYEKCN